MDLDKHWVDFSGCTMLGVIETEEKPVLFFYQISSYKSIYFYFNYHLPLYWLNVLLRTIPRLKLRVQTTDLPDKLSCKNKQKTSQKNPCLICTLNMNQIGW